MSVDSSGTTSAAGSNAADSPPITLAELHMQFENQDPVELFGLLQEEVHQLRLLVEEVVQREERVRALTDNLRMVMAMFVQWTSQEMYE